MPRKMLLALLATVLSLSLVAAACSDGDDDADDSETTTAEPQGVAELRVMHDYTSSTVVKPAPVDVYISAEEISPGEDTPAIEDLQWGTLTRYLDVPSGTYDIGVYAAGGRTELFTAEGVEFAPDVTYTAWARRASTTDDSMQVELIDETQLDEPEPGGAAVTAAHGVPLAAANGVRIGAAGLGCLGGGVTLTFPDTETVQLDAAPVQLGVYAPTDVQCTGTPLIGPAELALEADESYLVFVAGTSTGDLMLVPGGIRSL